MNHHMLTSIPITAAVVRQPSRRWSSRWANVVLLSIFVLLHLDIVHGSFFRRGYFNHEGHHETTSLTMRESSLCGSHHMPCSANEPCCNNGTCHATSMQACPISLGCDPLHSHLEGCFSLPACLSFKDKFKQPSLLIPKRAFTGDPNQAHWVSEFHHIAPYAKVSKKHHKLQLRVRRDMVRTQSGGGFGATISSTRWNKYGTFTAKFMSGSTGPGIVTAVLLSNPAMGEEISFELTGKDPKKVITNYYLRVPIPDHDHDHTSERSHQNKHLHLEPSQQHHRHHNFHRHAHTKLLSHEEIHDLKHDSTQHELIYKIEWTDQMIRWSVDGKILRTVYAKDTPRSILSTGSSGLPTNAMQLQLTIWDAGYLPDVSEWAGGKTDYGEADTNEYVATVDSVEINCRDSKEGRKSWPGPDAMRRLKIAATRDKKLEKLARMSSVGDHGVVTSVKEFFEVALLSLIKWTFVLLSIVCGAAYLTEPKVNSLRPVRTSGLTTVQMSS